MKKQQEELQELNPTELELVDGGSARQLTGSLISAGIRSAIKF